MVESISELATCAVRYALGRATYVSWSVPRGIQNLSENISTHALQIMLTDIREYRKLNGKIGMDCEDFNWAAFERWIERELERRKNGTT